MKLALSLTVVAATAFSIGAKVNSQPPDAESTPKSSIGLTGYMAYVVDEVRTGSPTKDAGLKRYDLVLSINNQTLSSPNDLKESMAKVEPGQPVEVMFMRYNPEKKEYEIHKMMVEAAPRP